MALIPCKYCGKEISDKAITCPHCGNSLIQETITCEECGSEIPVNATECPFCGFPVNKKTADLDDSILEIPKKESHAKRRILIPIIVVILLAGCITGVLLFHKAKKEAEIAEAERIKVEYYQNISETVAKMQIGAEEAEEAGQLIYDVWYNNLLEIDDAKTDKYTKRKSGGFYEDFNDALQKLFDDSSFVSRVKKIDTNQLTVSSLMSILVNPPEECVEAYNIIQDLYAAYLDITSCVTDPNGYTITSYSSTFQDGRTSFSKYLKKIQPYLVD